MRSILDRYILRELAVAVLAVITVLVVVLAGGILARVLQNVANGAYPASIMFSVLGLSILSIMQGIIPLGTFLGLLTGLGRLYQDSEMYVLSASGMGFKGLLRPAMTLVLPMVILAGVLSLWIAPWAHRTTDQLINDANHSVTSIGFEPGQFSDIPGGQGMLFAAGMSHDGKVMDDVLVVQQIPAEGKAPAALKVITAKSSQLYSGGAGQRRFLKLFDGWQYKIPVGQDNWDRMRYQRNDIELPLVVGGPSETSSGIGSGTSTRALWQHGNAEARAEIDWRISAPLVTLVLALLAFPFARQSPRQSRYGRLVVAILSYFLYFSLLSLSRSLIGQGNWVGSTLLWLIHALVIAGSLMLLYRQYVPVKRKRVST